MDEWIAREVLQFFMYNVILYETHVLKPTVCFFFLQKSVRMKDDEFDERNRPLLPPSRS